MGPRRRRHLFRGTATAAALLAVLAAVAGSSLASASTSRPYRIGSAVLATKAAHKPAPSPTATATPAASPSPTGSGSGIPDCGGSTPLKADGTPWQCSFDDEFGGAGLDRSKWTVQTTARSGYVAGSDCYVDNPNNVSVSTGTLKLTARRESAPFTCTGSHPSQVT